MGKFAAVYYKVGNLDSMANFRKEIIAGYEAILHLFSVKTTAFVLSGLLLLLVYIVATWFSAIGNYAAACVGAFVFAGEGVFKRRAVLCLAAYKRGQKVRRNSSAARTTDICGLTIYAD